MPQLELVAQDHAFIVACITGMVRRAQQSTMPLQQQIHTTTAAAETISRLNSGEISHQDVDFICLCIKKTVDLLDTDRGLPMHQRNVVRKIGRDIQEKFTRAMHVPLPHIWNDRKRENDSGETPSEEVQVQ